jgi:hypothetical protein
MVVRHEVGPVVALEEVVPQPLEVPVGWKVGHIQAVLAGSLPGHILLVHKVRPLA